MAEGSVSILILTFHGDTRELLSPDYRREPAVSYPLTRRASLKDIIESLGVPHTEVGAITAGAAFYPLTTIAGGFEHYHIHPQPGPLAAAGPDDFSSESPPEYRFMVDINVARLGRLLRMAGFDARPAETTTPQELIDATNRERRILLTRNRDLLKHREVRYGRLLRSSDSFKQFLEIVDRYQLSRLLRPFQRCMACNGLLQDVPKSDIIDRLEPLTKKYYSRFKRCQNCQKIFWRGSHYEKMSRIIDTIHSRPSSA